MTEIAEMTDDELQLAIARKLGWHTDVREISGRSWMCRVLITPSGEVYEDEFSMPWQFPCTPDMDRLLILNHTNHWPTDVEDALALCLDVRKRLNEQADAGEWALVFASGLLSDTVGLLYRCNGEDTHAITADGHNARAMAELALRALQQDD